MEVDYHRYYPHWVDEFKRCADWIDGALAYTNGDYDLKDIADGLHSGHYQLWTCETAAVVTRINQTPKTVTLHIFLAGGDMAGAEQLYHECEAWAKQQNMDAITIIGRPGWKRSFLTNAGMQQVSYNMTKRLDR